MEKETIISTLTEKLGQTQLSGRTIATYVENNMPAEGSEPDDAYWTRGTNFLKSLQGQFSADVAAQVNSFKAEWAKNHPEPKPTDPPTPPTPPTPPATDEATKKLLERLEAMEKKLKDAEDNNAKGKRVAAIVGKAKELNVANEYLWSKTAGAVEIKEGMSDEDLLSAVKAAYEAELKAIIGNGASPYGVSRTPNPNEGQKAMDDYFKGKFGK